MRPVLAGTKKERGGIFLHQTYNRLWHCLISHALAKVKQKKVSHLAGLNERSRHNNFFDIRCRILSSQEMEMGPEYLAVVSRAQFVFTAR